MFNILDDEDSSSENRLISARINMLSAQSMESAATEEQQHLTVNSAVLNIPFILSFYFISDIRNTETYSSTILDTFAPEFLRSKRANSTKVHFKWAKNMQLASANIHYY